MANYIIARNGELKQCDNNTLAHANGWKKKGAKYIKRIPKPGGGWTYVYKESGLEARSNLGNTQANLKKSLTTNRGMSGVAVNRVAGTNTQIAKNKYDKTPAGKLENAAKSAASKVKTATKKAKESKALSDLSVKAGRIKEKVKREVIKATPFVVDNSPAAKYERAKKKVEKALKKTKKKIKKALK